MYETRRPAEEGYPRLHPRCRVSAKPEPPANAAACHGNERFGLFHAGLIAGLANRFGDRHEGCLGGVEADGRGVGSEVHLHGLDTLDLSDGLRDVGHARRAGHAFDRKSHVLGHHIDPPRDNSSPKLIAITPSASVAFTTEPFFLFQRPIVPRTRRFDTKSRNSSSGRMNAML